MLGPHPADVAAFLADTPGLSKSMIGDYLGEREDAALAAMHAYVDRLDFAGLEFDEAIRAFLQARALIDHVAGISGKGRGICVQEAGGDGMRDRAQAQLDLNCIRP